MLNKLMRKAIKEANAVKPQNVNGQFNLRCAFYKDYLLSILKGMIKIECKDTVLYDEDYVRESLIFNGAIGCFESDTLGLLLYTPTLYSPNIFFRCGKARYVMQNYGGVIYEREIGEDTEIVYFRGSDTVSLLGVCTYPINIVDIYAQKLASVDASIDVNLINTRATALIEVESSQQKASAEKMFDKISRGEPVVFLKSNAIDSRGINIERFPAKDNYLVDKLQDAKRSIMNEFLTAWGINNANTDKKERLNADEVHSNDGELRATTEIMIKSLKAGCDRVNKMFDVGLSIEIENYRGGENNATQRNAEIVRDAQG